MYEAFHEEHHGIAFSLPSDWYETDEGFGMEVRYRHEWNSAGKFRLQVRGETYDWNDLRRFLKPTDRVEQQALVTAIEFHFRSLRDLSPLELEVVADARKGGHNEPLGAQLRVYVQAEFEGWVPDAAGQAPPRRQCIHLDATPEPVLLRRRRWRGASAALATWPTTFGCSRGDGVVT